MKYYSSVLAVFKNESHIIEEWVEHYKSIGIQKIYLLNDFSEDNFLDKIQKHIDSNFIEIKNVLKEDDDKDMDWRQKYLYNKYYGNILKETNWLAILDLDEFLYSPKTKNINEILQKYDNKPQQELVIDWYLFGSNDYAEQPKNVIESFIKRGEKFAREYNMKELGYEPEWCCKSFAKTKLISKLCHHFNFFNYLEKSDFCSIGLISNNFNINISNIDEMYINHYVQSRRQYSKKRKRGSCNNTPNIIRNRKLFDVLDKNDVIDTRLKDQK
jgi:hypothetical protein